MTWQSKFLSVHEISPDGVQLFSLALDIFYLSTEYFRLFGQNSKPLYIPLGPKTAFRFAVTLEFCEHSEVRMCGRGNKYNRSV